MVSSLIASRMPSWGRPIPDWTEPLANIKLAPHFGAAGGFSYIAPTPKYVEAYTSQTGPGWGGYATYLNYNHGNQPYNPIDSGLNTAFRTPTQPNWYALSKVSPKTSSSSVQAAQKQVGNMLMLRTPIGSVNQ